MDDLELLEAWKAGDAAAGDELFRRHFETLYVFFRNKAEPDIEDLIQQTLLGCVEARDRFRQASSFKTFMLAVARNTLLAHLRSRRRERDRLDFTTVSVADLATSPSAALARADDKQVLLHALRAIPVEFQIALELFYWEGLSGPELAEVLGVPEGTVRTRLRRARKLVLDGVGEPGSGDADADADFDAWARSLRETTPRNRRTDDGH